MSRSEHTEAQIIAALKQVEAERTAEDVAREQGMSKHMIYAWKGTDWMRRAELRPHRGVRDRLGICGVCGRAVEDAETHPHDLGYVFQR